MPRKQRSKEPAPSTPDSSSTPTTCTSAPSTEAVDTDTDILLKPSRTAWKNGIQSEFLASRFEDFLDHQDKGTLARFWPPIYDAWYKKWHTPAPTPLAIAEHGSPANATLVLRSGNNRVRPQIPTLEPPSIHTPC